MGLTRKRLLVFCIFLSALLPFMAAAMAKAMPYSGKDAHMEKKHKDTMELLKKNDYDRVISLEEPRVEEDPGDLMAYLLLTVGYLGKGEEKKAIELASRAKKVDERFTSEIYASMGRFYITKKRLHKALIYLHESVNIKEDPEVVKAIGSVYLGQGLIANAKKYYERVLDTSPDYVSLGRIYLAESDYDNAINCALLAIKQNEKAPGGYLVLGTGYILSGKAELARTNFRILKELNPDFFLNSYFLGVIETVQRNYDEALAHFTAMKKSVPGIKEPYLHSAVLLHLKGDLEKAGQEARKAIETDPLDATAHFILGNILLSGREQAKAREEFRKSADLFQDFSLTEPSVLKRLTEDENLRPAFLSLSLLLSRAGIYGESVKAADESSGGGEATPLALILKAGSEAQRDTKAAEKIYATLIEQYPDLLSPYMGLGELREKREDVKGALALYEKARAIAGDSVSINLKIGSLYEKSGDADNAAESYRRVIKASPQSVDGYNRLASVLANMKNDLPGALESASRGVSVNPEDPDARDILAWTFFRLGRSEDALKNYMAIVKNGTKNPVIYYRLGMVYQKLNDRKGAMDAFEKALDINDEFQGSHEAKKILKNLSGLG